MLDYRYRAFISYSHRDSAWADWLQRALESYRIPSRLIGLTTRAGVIPARLAPVFRDRDELPSATDLSRKVGEVLAQSACLIVVCSPHSAQSHWVDEEVKAFQRLGRADRIYCLIVDGEPGASAWPGREHDESLSPALKQRFDAAGAPAGEPFEPIAADARPGKDGKANARIKLIAGMLGVDLDDLKHRERRRRRWQIFAGVAVGVLLLCLTSVLAINAVIARYAAERRQKQAEELVTYMLGDLDDRLRQVNRLDIIESVVDKVVKYFDDLPAADVNDNSTALRAQALLKLGAVRRDEGRVAAARDAFNEALAGSEKLVQHAPDEAQYQAIRAESLTWLGFIDWSQGRLDDTLQRFGAARDTLLRVSALHPGDLDVLDRLGAAHTNAGRVYEARGQLDDARREYAKVLEGYSDLSRQQPEKLEWKSELGYAHNNLAQLALKEGNLEEAVKEYVADREIKVNLAGLDPADNMRREDLVASEGFLGRVLHLCGETDASKRHLRAAMDAIESLLLVDPHAADWLEKAGSYGWMLGQIARADGDLAEAGARDALAVARLSELVRKDVANVVWQRKLAQAQMENARRLLAGREIAAATDAALVAKEAGAAALAGAPDDVTSQLVVAQSDLLHGDIAAALGETESARKAWSAAAAAISARANASKDPALLDAWIGARLRLGEADDLTPELDALLRTGYRDPDFMALIGQYGTSAPERGALQARIGVLAGQASMPAEPHK
ncbi:MAG: TIR domain-containing protein [Rhodanobacteraceae bacterium]